MPAARAASPIDKDGRTIAGMPWRRGHPNQTAGWRNACRPTDRKTLATRKEEHPMNEPRLGRSRFPIRTGHRLSTVMGE